MQMVFEQTVVTHSGPLPAPTTLREYEDMLPRAADRIVRMAERDQQFIHGYQLRRQKGLFIGTYLGQGFGFVLGLAAVTASVILVLNDKPLAGFATALLAAATLIGAAVWGKMSPEKKATPSKEAKLGDNDPGL
jgi:uncharacterized membrane protein